MAFGGRDGVRYPPPLSVASKLNNPTCRVEKKNRAHSVVLRITQMVVYGLLVYGFLCCTICAAMPYSVLLYLVLL